MRDPIAMGLIYRVKDESRIKQNVQNQEGLCRIRRESFLCPARKEILGFQGFLFSLSLFGCSRRNGCKEVVLYLPTVQRDGAFRLPGLRAGAAQNLMRTAKMSPPHGRAFYRRHFTGMSSSKPACRLAHPFVPFLLFQGFYADGSVPAWPASCWEKRFPNGNRLFF